ncbi:MAG: hypothetical protein LBT38_10355 [Deltaproteobacteria bacterium]|nr:hypothetical protein [Deltaproteobacteria bacterium]
MTVFLRPDPKVADEGFLKGLLEGTLPDARGWTLDNGFGSTLAHVAAENGLLPPEFQDWGLLDWRRATVAHVAAKARRLPLTFNDWELRDAIGRTVAHEVAELGPLPPGFDLWTLQDRCGVSVAEVAWGYDHLPRGVFDWRALTRAAREPVNLRPTFSWSGDTLSFDPEIRRKLEERLAVKFPTLRDISENCWKGQRFVILMGDFLDAFYMRKRVTRELMIQDCPQDGPENWQLPFLAATASLLARRFDLKTPPWTERANCFLPENESYCPVDLDEPYLKAIKAKSPLEFLSRNIIVDWTTLYRV